MPRRNLKISSPNYYVTTTANNRIKVWQLKSMSHTKNEIGTLFTELFEPNYLKIHYTAIAIFDDHQNINNNNSLLVLGDKIGRIVLFNITKSCKVLEISQHTRDASKDFKHTEGGHHSRITCIRFHIEKDLIHIVTCSKDKKVCRWDLNGTLLDTIHMDEDRIPSCFALTKPFKMSIKKTKKKKQQKHKSNQYLMVASNHIDVYRTQAQQSPACIGSFQGHAQQTRRMKLSDDNQYLISCGLDRFVYIWKCKSFYKKKPDKSGLNLKSAEYSLALDDDIVSIDIKTITKPLTSSDVAYLQTLQDKKQKKKKKDIGSTKEVYLIAAASKSFVYIWCFDPIQLHQSRANDEEVNGNLEHVVAITVADDSNSDKDNDSNSMSWIQYIQFMNDKQLMVLRGTCSMAVMKQIEFIDSDKEFIARLVLENVTTGMHAEDKNIDLTTNALESQENVAVDPHLTVLHVADVSIANPKSYEQQERKDKKRKRQNGDMSSAQPPTKKQRVQSDSMTFQDKLYAIERKTEEDKNNKGFSGIPNADSLYMLLTQSLKANDQTMFERLLTMQNDETMREFEGDLIKNTLDRISSQMAVDLLEKLTEKFRVSPRQSISILRWLLPLLNSHSASFAKNLSSRKHLISIHQAIDYQIKSLLPAMKLQGRLSLLMNQMQKVTQFTQNNNDNKPNITNGLEMARNKALFVHNEQTILDEQNQKRSKNANGEK